MIYVPNGKFSESKYQHCDKHECIPVGWIPPTPVATTRCQSPRGGRVYRTPPLGPYLPRTIAPLPPPGTMPPSGRNMGRDRKWHHTTFPRGQNDRHVQKHYLPGTSFAGVNNGQRCERHPPCASTKKGNDTCVTSQCLINYFFISPTASLLSSRHFCHLERTDQLSIRPLKGIGVYRAPLATSKWKFPLLKQIWTTSYGVFTNKTNVTFL